MSDPLGGIAANMRAISPAASMLAPVFVTSPDSATVDPEALITSQANPGPIELASGKIVTPGGSNEKQSLIMR